MFLKKLSNTSYVFLIVLLISRTKLANSVDDGEHKTEVIHPSEDDEWEEEEPEVPKYEVPKGVQTLTFNPANLTDEDQHSPHMPRDLACDGCRIVAYVMTEKLKKIQGRYKKGYRLPESDVIDILDELCNDQNVFDGYGIKEIKGVRRLSGEGLETKDVPGVMQGGGKWPFRLHSMCLEYIGELGEDVIYDHFLERKSLENLMCRSQQLGNICPPKKKTKKAKKDKKPKEEL